MKGKKRIAINATSVGEDPTGLGVYTYEMLAELLKTDHDFVIFASSGELKRRYGERVISVSPRTSPALGGKGHLARYLWEQTVLPWELWRQKVSLLYSTVPEGILNPFSRQKQIITVLDIIPAKYHQLFPKMRYHFLYDLPILLRNAKRVVCASENTKRDLISFYGIRNKPISVVYPGLNRQRFYPREKGPVKKRYGFGEYLFYVGDMRPYKNLDRCLKAFAKLNFKDLRFVVAGQKDPRFYPRLKKEVDRLSLKDRVLFVGYVPGEDLPFLYSEAKALVFPSLYEGFGLPPLEAMACGCPVVTSHAASLPEVCGKAAHYVDPEKVDSIAEGMHKSVTDTELRQTLIQRGIERAKLFSWEKGARQVLDIFEELL
jgi:glycosyltransferase involved in cell wall biosynthesis